MCIFCSIVNGSIPCHKIYEDEHTLAFLDISCDTEGHTLVVPKTHARNVLSCPDTVYTQVMNTAKRVATRLHGLGYEGVNILTNAEPSAGQTVFHFHVHVVPRTAGDNLKIGISLGEEKPMDLVAVANRIRFS